MTDRISRADAIEAIMKHHDGELNQINYGLTLAKNEIQALPSADAVQGEWIHDGQNFIGGLNWCHCSECGYKTSANGLSVYRFCPSCGARMEANE